MSISTGAILRQLTEAPSNYVVPQNQAIRQFWVDYYVTTRTPKGSRTRFQRQSGLNQIRGAKSETAVWGYLQSLHPGCDIQIQALEWR
jgi:hypothetical protein